MTIWHCICLMWSADVTLQKCHPSADLGVTPQTEQVEILSTSLCLWAVEQMLCQVCPYKRSPRQHLKQIFIFKLRYLFLTIKIEISDIHCSAITYSCNKMSGVNSRRLLWKLWKICTKLSSNTFDSQLCRCWDQWKGKPIQPGQ